MMWQVERYDAIMETSADTELGVDMIALCKRQLIFFHLLIINP
jgi:hypothetical protein